MSDPSGTRSVLTHVDPLRGGLVRLAMVGTKRSFRAGDVLMRQGDPSDALYIVLSGRVRVERAFPELAEPVLLAEVGPEEVLGEMGVLENAPRSATVRALEDTETIEVAARAPVLAQLLREAPEILAALLRVANRRLRRGEEVVRHTLEDVSRLKSEFISITSHELRTPMTTILGFSELLLKQTPADDPRRQFLSVIHADSQQLARLVENLLDASRIDNGWMKVEPSTVDLATHLPPLLATLGASATRHQVTLDVQTPSGTAVVVDPIHLDQVVSNLVSNAIKYSPAGGQVRVHVEAVGNGTLEISVADQGVGIPAEAQARIFERFQRVESPETQKVSGTGLGLYIVKHLVEMNGGTVSVRSTLGQGSTFSVRLPAADRSAECWVLSAEATRGSAC
jgi:signal transduction histidine kinase